MVDYLYELPPVGRERVAGKGVQDFIYIDLSKNGKKNSPMKFLQVASSQAYDIRSLCNKVSSSTRGGGGAALSAAAVGYADTEPRYRCVCLCVWEGAEGEGQGEITFIVVHFLSRFPKTRSKNIWNLGIS